MSEFSDLFSHFIKEKDIKVYSMVKYCRLDRSTMYKLINGKRNPPSEEIFHKISEFMHLTPAEYEEFQKAYQITLLGRNTYFKRKNVENFILNFPNNSYAPVLPPPLKYMPFKEEVWKDLPTCMALTNQLELNYVLHHILIAESNKENGHIALFLQPDYDFLFSLLANLKSPSLQIDHILCLSRTEQMSEKQELYNLSYLKTIFPLYISALQYQPYYYYEDIHSHYYSFNAFPCMILTRDYAIVSTSDYKTGILFHDEKIIALLWDLYNFYQNKCTPIFHLVDSVLEECFVLGNMGWEDSTSFVIQPEPCLIPYITPEILENAVHPFLPNREHLLPYLRQFLASSRARISNKNIHLYHTQQGIELFAETGRIQEIPMEIYRPFTLEERIFLLKSMLPYCYDGHYRLLKKPLDHLPENLHLCINSSSGYLLCTNARNQNIYLIIEEPGLLSTFLDYAESLDNKNLSNGEETANCVKSIIRKLEHKLRP